MRGAGSIATRTARHGWTGAAWRSSARRKPTSAVTCSRRRTHRRRRTTSSGRSGSDLRDPVGPDNWPEDYAWFDWWLQLWRVEPFGARTNPRGADRRVVFRMDPAVFQGIRVTVERWPGYDGPWESAGMIDIPPAHLWGTIPPNDQPFDYFDIDDAYPTPTGEIVGAVTPSGNAAVSVGAVPVQNADFNRGRSLVFHGGHDTRRIRLQASILGAWPQQGGPLNRTVLGRLNVRLVRRFGASTPAHWRSTLAYWRENVPADLRMQYEETPDDGRR